MKKKVKEEEAKEEEGKREVREEGGGLMLGITNASDDEETDSEINVVPLGQGESQLGDVASVSSGIRAKAKGGGRLECDGDGRVVADGGRDLLRSLSGKRSLNNYIHT